MANIPTTNNNPGNLRDNSGKFRVFKSPLEGQTALYNDLTVKMTGKSTTGLTGNSSLFEFAQKYAPKSDGNDPANYAANLANELGISPDTKIGTLMPRIDDFAKAVAKHEGYKGAWASGATNAAPKGGQMGTGATQTTPTGSGFLPVNSVPPTNPDLAGNLNVAAPSASFGQKALNVGNTVAGVMGMQPFGQGIATAMRTIAGHGNDEGNAQGAAVKQLSDILAKYPVGSAERKAALANYNKLYSGGVPTQAEIDPGTALSRKAVAKSAGETALWALSGGSLPFKGMQSGAIAQRAEGVGAPLLWKALKPVLKPTIKAATTSGGLLGNLLRATILNKIITEGSGGKVNPGKYLFEAFKEL